MVMASVFHWVFHMVVLDGCNKRGLGIGVSFWYLAALQSGLRGLVQRKVSLLLKQYKA